MQKITSYIIYTAFVMSVGFAGCKKEDPIVLDPIAQEAIPADPTDFRIFEFKGKYESTFLYRWNRNFFGSEAVVAPPLFEKVLPYVDFVERVWVKPYDFQVKGFMRKNLPREIVLAGTTMKYEDGGESTFNAAGQAISSSRIILTDLNSADWDSNTWYLNAGRTWMNEQAKTMHHEFAHILDKKYGRPSGFDNISKGLYAGTSSFKTFTQEEARNRGFWIPYGMSNEEEDFATFVEGLLTTQKRTFLEAIEGNPKLEQKYQLVYQYYLKMGIDVHTLQEQIAQSIDGFNIDN